MPTGTRLEFETPKTETETFSGGIMTIRRFLCYGAIALAATAAMSCGFSTPQYIPIASPTLVPLPLDAEVVETDIVGFEHSDFEIEVGTWIVWNNKTTAFHTASHTPLETGEQRVWASPEMQPGDLRPAHLGTGEGSWRYQFNDVRTYFYRCLIHPSVMKGKVVVKERSGT
jgi:plastocyanin